MNKSLGKTFLEKKNFAKNINFNFKELKESIKKIQQNKEKIKSISFKKKSYNFVKNNFNWKSISNIYIENYRKILKK